MSVSDLAQVIEQDHQADDAFAKGDPGPKKALYSRRDDAVLANPLLPPARGWAEVEKALDYAASGLAPGGELLGIDGITDYQTKDLAYIVEIERYRLQLPKEEAVPRSLRVTTIFRLEDGEWRIAHRHADTITAARTHAEALRP
jgi:ketosteroid isomerase-like protein